MKKVVVMALMALGILNICLYGCSFKTERIYITEHRSPLEPVMEAGLVAGAAKVDITPPPGMPLAGFSKLCDNSVGVRSKLMARAFYIKSGTEKPVALVQCDLLAGTLIVHHKVAEQIAGETDIDAGGLVIAGTHTHSGPGNFFGSMFYNNMASNKSGFDNRYFEFLCNQIATAVIDAYTHRRPARIATGTTTVTGVTKNRSLGAYLRNKNIIALEEKPDQYEAVNPYLHMIRLDCLDDDGRYKPIGAFTNFSLHPNTNPRELGLVYSGDIFAYIERDLEWAIKRHYQPPWKPVHGAANYTHGDNNPNHSEEEVENFKDHRRLGRRVAEKAFELFVSLDNKMEDKAIVRYGTREIDLFEERSINGIKIAGRPVVGMATPAGAQGRGRSTPISKIPFFAPEWPRWIFTGGEHGRKRKVGGPLQYLILPKKNFPHYMLLQVIQVKDMVLLPLPLEVTYEMGLRIAAKVRERGEAAGMEKGLRVVVTSTSNGFWGYLTTPEEYELQYYEGGSNLYGPNTGDFLAAQLASNIEEMAKKGSYTIMPHTLEFRMQTKTFYPEPISFKGVRVSYQPPVYHHKQGREEPYFSFKWVDVPAHLIAFHKGLVQIETSEDGREWIPFKNQGIPVDDYGYDIAIYHRKTLTKENMALYEARWYNPPLGETQRFRFVILPRDQQEILYSEAFHAAP